MIGSDLERRNGYATRDIEEMIEAEAVLPESVNIVIYGGGTDKWHNPWFDDDENCIVVLEKTGPVLLAKDGKKNMDDGATLQGFLSWCAEHYPAENNILIFWDHGGGALTGFGYDVRFFDEDYLLFAEIDSAIAASGISLKLVGFDACLMGTVETALVLSTHTDYIVASEEAESIYGWDYTTWMTKALSGEKFDALQTGKTIVDSFVETSIRETPNIVSTLAVTDCAVVREKVISTLDAFSKVLTEKTAGGEFGELSKLVSNTEKISYINAADAIDAVYLAELFQCPEGDAFASALREAIVYSRTNRVYKRMNGLSIFLPYKEIKAGTFLERIKAAGSDERTQSYIHWLECFSAFFHTSEEQKTQERTLYDVFVRSSERVIKDSLQLERITKETKTVEYLRDHRLNIDVLRLSRNENNRMDVVIPEDQAECVTNLYQKTFVENGDRMTYVGNICIPYDGDELSLNMEWNTFNSSWVFLDDRVCPFFLNRYEQTEDR